MAFDNDVVDALAIALNDDGRTHQRMMHLEGCIATLDVKARELWRLRYELDLKPAAIAERIDGNANTVAKALQRVRDRIRDCIDRKVAAEGVL